MTIATPTPKTWTADALLTESDLNSEVRDVLRFLTSGCECTVTLGSNQSVPNSSATAINWDTQLDDVDGIITVPSTTFTFTRAGVIALRFYGTYAGASGGTSRNFRASVNDGSTDYDLAGVSDGPSADGSWQSGMCLSVDFPVDVGYTVKFYAFQDSGSALNIVSAKTQATLTWVGKLQDWTDYDSPPSVEPGDSTPPTSDTPTKHTAKYYSTWSRTYISDGSVRWDDSKYCYQGAYPGYGGNQRSLAGFDSASIVSDLAGAQNVSMNLVFYVAHSYYYSGITTVIGGHNYSSKPSSWSDGNVDQNLQQCHSDDHKTRTVALNSTLVNRIKSGQYKGIAFGPAPSTALQYYGFYNGATMTTKPRLEVTYYK